MISKMNGAISLLFLVYLTAAGVEGACPDMAKTQDCYTENSGESDYNKVLTVHTWTKAVFDNLCPKKANVIKYFVCINQATSECTAEANKDTISTADQVTAAADYICEQSPKVNYTCIKAKADDVPKCTNSKMSGVAQSTNEEKRNFTCLSTKALKTCSTEKFSGCNEDTKTITSKYLDMLTPPAYTACVLDRGSAVLAIGTFLIASFVTHK